MSNKYISKGSKITVSISGTQTLVPSVDKIQPPDDGFDLYDASAMDDNSTVMIPDGWDNPDKVTVELVSFDSKNAVHAALMAAKYSKAKKDFVITGPTEDPYTLTFSGYVTKCPPGSLERKKGAAAQIEISLYQQAVYAAAP